MLEYRIDKLVKRLVKYDRYIVYRYKSGVLSKLNEQRKYWNPYIIKNKKSEPVKYIVFRNSIDSGSVFFSFIKSFIFSAEWADKNGYIPIADIEYENCYMDGELGTDNQFEYCFSNPADISVIKNAENVLVYALNTSIDSEQIISSPYVDGNKVIINETDTWREYYSSIKQLIDKWIKPTDDFKKYLSDNHSICVTQDRCIGVFVRELFHSDFQELIYDEQAKKLLKKHPKADSIANVIKMIRTQMTEWNCNKVFVATQCRDTLNAFVDEFGEDVSFVDRKRVSMTDMADRMNSTGMDVTNDDKLEMSDLERVRAYAAEVMLLAKCNCFVSSKSGGAAMVMAFNGGEFEHVHFLKDMNNSTIY